MLSRRGFILTGLAACGGLILVYTRGRLDDGSAPAKFAASGRPGTALNAWLKIDTDGGVTCGIHRAEMGQAVTTGLAMLLIEELDAAWEDVRFEFVPVDRDYYNFGMLLNGQPLGDPEASWLAGTGTWAIRQVFHAIGMSMTISSSSLIDGWDTLRPAGAIARQMLVDAAARRWGVAPERLRTESGFVIDKAGGDRIAYGDLAEAAARETPTSNPVLKDPSTYRLIGHDPPRLDTRLKVTGAAEFGIDVTRPDMLHAVVVHSPVAGSVVASFASNGADRRPGVHGVFPVGRPGAERAVAVVADNTWQALVASRDVSVTPAAVRGGLANTDTLGEQYRELLGAADPAVFRDGEDIEASLASADASAEAVYEVPFLSHACMEPMNATALYSESMLEIWAPTQAHSVARDIAADMTGLGPRQVRVHTTFLGGGFGRRAEMDFVEQAVSAAMRHPGRPVKLTWSREQDMRHDAYRPAAVCRVRGGVGAGGELAVLDYRLVTQSVVASYEERTPTPRGGDARSDSSVVEALNPPIYPVADLEVAFVPAQSHVPAGYWRSVSHSWNTFFIESFIDELAVSAGVAPLEFRRRALAQRPRHVAVLDAVAERVGDSPAAGYAVAESHATVAAHAVVVETAAGRFARVQRVVCAIDCGPIIHPDNVRAQVESSIVDGLSSALYERVTFRDGVAQPGNFDTYPRLRMHETPEIEVIVMQSRHARPGGVGEPAVPGVAPALVNAIFAATGERIRRLPAVPRG